MRALWALLAASLLAALLVPASAAGAERYSFVKGWGSKGSDNGQFGFLGSLATDPAGNVYVPDGDNRRVQVFDRKGRFLRKWSSPGYEIAIDRSGNVYVGDFTVVRVFSSTGRFLTQWQGTDTNIDAIGTDNAGSVYVGVTGPEIRKFSAHGSFITSWGGGTSRSGFVGIHSLATGPTGDVFAGVDGPRQIASFTANGAFLTEWGPFGRRSGQIRDAQGLATDSRGNVYVVDGKNQRVQKFTADGRFLTTFGVGLFTFPRGIAVGADGAVYIASDYGIHKFLPSPARPQASPCTKPTRTTRSRRACFRFRSGTAAVRFQCRLTGKGASRKQQRWRSCSPPKRYGGLGLGKKLFQVRAVSGAGAKSKPARYRWSVVG